MPFPSSFAAVPGTLQLYSSRFAQSATVTVAATAFRIYSSTNGTTWTQRFSHAVASSVAAAWSPSLPLFVAHTGKKILTSPDGTTWTTQVATTAFELNDLEWSPSLNLFIGCGKVTATGNGTVQTSPDGVTWTERSNLAGRRWNGIAVNGNQCVVVGSDNPATQGLRLTSTDGLSWVEAQISATDHFLDIERSAALYVAVGKAVASDTGVVYTSPDGAAWTKRTVPAIRALTQLLWSSAMGAYVAAADDPGLASPQNDLLYSEDAVAWTKPSVTPYMGVSGAVYVAPNLILTASTVDSPALAGDANIVSSITVGTPATLPLTMGTVSLVYYPSYDGASITVGVVGLPSIHVLAYDGAAITVGDGGPGAIYGGAAYDGASITWALGGGYGDSYDGADIATGAVITPEVAAGAAYDGATATAGRGFNVSQSVGNAYGGASITSGKSADILAARGGAYGGADATQGRSVMLQTAHGAAYGGADATQGRGAAAILAHGMGYDGAAYTVSAHYRSANYDGAAIVVGSAFHGAAQAFDPLLYATVMNVSSAETTRWTNVGAMRIVRLGNDHYAVKHDGLYRLDREIEADFAANGARAEINGTVLTKDKDFGVFQTKTLHYVYANSDDPGRLKVTPYYDGVEKLPHTSRYNDRKVQMAKGVSGRYIQLRIENIRDLSGIDERYIIRQRSVK